MSRYAILLGKPEYPVAMRCLKATGKGSLVALNHTLFAGVQLVVMVGDIAVPASVTYLVFALLFGAFNLGLTGIIASTIIIIPLSVGYACTKKHSAWRKKNIKRCYKVMCR